MKILQLSQEKLKSSGISLHQSNQNYPFNTRNLIPLFVYALSVASSIVYFFVVPKKFEEYIVSAYVIVVILINVAFYFILIFKMSKLFEFTLNFEDIIEKSE